MPKDTCARRCYCWAATAETSTAILIPSPSMEAEQFLLALTRNCSMPDPDAKLLYACNIPLSNTVMLSTRHAEGADEAANAALDRALVLLVLLALATGVAGADVMIGTSSYATTLSTTAAKS